MDATILDRVLAVSSLLQHDMNRAFSGTGLTETRVHALWVLQHLGALTQQKLAEALQVTPRSVSALVDGLERTGYLQRQPHPGDRRAVQLVLTPDAEVMMARMQHDHAELSQTLLAAIAPEDRAAFDRGLDALHQRLSDLIAGDHVQYGLEESTSGFAEAQRNAEDR